MPRRRSSLFSERDKAARGYAEATTRCDRRVDEEVVSRLRAHFDDQSIIELAALGVPAHGFCSR